jgi:hypothetical protein
VGKPKRERERSIIQLQESVLQQQTNNFQPRKIPHSTNKQSQKSVLKNVPKPYSCTASKSYLKKCAHSQLYGLFRTAQNSQEKPKKMPRKPCQKCLDFHAKFVLLYGLYGSVQYGLPQQKNIWKNSQKIFLGFVPSFPWEMCPLCCSLSSLKLTQKISLTQLLSMSSLSTCLAHYPMHSFII